MKILGIDQSKTRTGWALLTDGRHSQSPQFTLGYFASPTLAAFGYSIKWLLGDMRPDFVVWERPNPRIMIYRKASWAGDTITPNADQLVLPAIAGMIEQACIERDLPYTSVASNTWRARVIGKGAGALKREAAKRAAKQCCDRLHIVYPNEDAAEAALIALYGQSCDAVRMLKHGEIHDSPKTAQNPQKSASK